MNNQYPELEKKIDMLWQEKDKITSHNTDTETEKTINDIMDLLDQGKVKVSYLEEKTQKLIVNQWTKQAILLSFRINDNKIMTDGYHNYNCYDKVELKFNNWTENDFKNHNIRAVPGTIVRKGAYVGKNVVLMPSFVNIGAYIDDGTMIDTWATVGSCAQIGKNCHISGGAGIGGVLEPIQANPVIIGDNVFIGARSEIAEGVIVGNGAVVSMGVYISASTKIVDRSSGEVLQGKIPDNAVVVPGTFSQNDNNSNVNLAAAIIVKYKDDKTTKKVELNNMLRNKKD